MLDCLTLESFNSVKSSSHLDVCIFISGFLIQLSLLVIFYQAIYWLFVSFPVNTLNPSEISQIQELLYNGYWAFECFTIRDYNDMICGVCGIAPKMEIAQRNTENVLHLKNVQVSWEEYTVQRTHWTQPFIIIILFFYVVSNQDTLVIGTFGLVVRTIVWNMVKMNNLFQSSQVEP